MYYFTSITYFLGLSCLVNSRRLCLMAAHVIFLRSVDAFNFATNPPGCSICSTICNLLLVSLNKPTAMNFMIFMTGSNISLILLQLVFEKMRGIEGWGSLDFCQSWTSDIWLISPRENTLSPLDFTYSTCFRAIACQRKNEPRSTV